MIIDVLNIMEAWNGLHLYRRISDELTGYMVLQAATPVANWEINEIDQKSFIRFSAI